MKIINLTQHQATQEQIAEGVVDLNDLRIYQLLTFDQLPENYEIIIDRAETLAEIAEKAGAEGAMIGGAPYLMAPLENALLKKGIVPMYAFSVRESREELLPDGTVKKVNIFRHSGFITVKK